MTGMNVIEQALPVVLKTLGGKLGVEIHIGGYQASTDGHTINIPALPIDGAPSLRVKAYGYGGHEASHIRNTDMGVFQAFAQQGPLAKHILNILEDVRIERALIADFPGMAPVLADLVGHLVSEDPDAFAPPILGDEPEVVLTSWLLISRRHRVLKQSALSAVDRQAQSVFEATFPMTFRRKLEALLVGLPYLRSGKEATKDTAWMAQAVLDLIQAESQTQQTQPQPMTGGQSDASQEASSSGAADDQPGNQPDSKEDGTSGDQADNSPTSGGSDQSGQGTDTPSATDGAPGDGAGQPGDASTDGSQSGGASTMQQAEAGQQPGTSSGAGNTPSEQDQRATLRKLAAKGAGANGVSDDLATDLGDRLGQALAMEASRCAAPTVSALPWGRFWNGKGQYANVEVARALSGPLRQRLRTLLEGEARVRPRARMDGRRLMASRLARTAIGDGRVFRAQEEARTIAAAMHILVDASGSMTNGRIQEADTSALAIAEAVDVLPRVNLGVSAFHNGRLLSMLRHGERLSSARQRFHIPNGGGTPLAEALVSVSGVLLNQKEDKKVMIVMTDGDPDGGPSTSRSLVGRLRQNGMIVLGVGIGVGTERFMPAIFDEDHRIIHDVADLREAVFQMAQTALRRH
ncbi:VWA domain-containing protein [Allochromatium humboldtianum]|uniref:VWA domain-containing protein n=1 Tax=Allochromatium humboldtianum TaxID=504901 RepID=A0A850RKY3_9GAMM|nr:VWA domain-containing protein [Allochromatium humboldtianum]NVZ11762.1 VWA domain-containing protein [Allochromatium humboldtianum]